VMMEKIPWQVEQSYAIGDQPRGEAIVPRS
jgi:hypothetical protein